MPSLTIQRCPFPCSMATIQNLIPVSPQLCSFYYQKMTQPASSHVSIDSSINFLLLHLFIYPFLLSYFREWNILLPLPSNTCIWASSCPILRGIEQTAQKSDLDSNPSSNILQLLPASLLPEYGVDIVIIGNCKFDSFVRQLPGKCKPLSWH